jgi:hypothetical protein
MSDVHVRKSNRGRKKTLTNSTRKLHKQDNSAKYNNTRICNGAEYDRWTALKDVLQLQLCGTTFRTISELKTVSTTLKV